MVNSRVRDQSSPSPMKHTKITVKFNQGSRSIENKTDNIYTFHTQSYLPLLFFQLHPLKLQKSAYAC